MKLIKHFFPHLNNSAASCKTTKAIDTSWIQHFCCFFAYSCDGYRWPHHKCQQHFSAVHSATDCSSWALSVPPESVLPASTSSAWWPSWAHDHITQPWTAIPKTTTIIRGNKLVWILINPVFYKNYENNIFFRLNRSKQALKTKTVALWKSSAVKVPIAAV